MSDIMEALKTIATAMTPILVGAAIGLTFGKLNEYTEASGERRELDSKRMEVELKRLEAEEAELEARKRAAEKSK